MNKLLLARASSLGTRVIRSAAAWACLLEVQAEVVATAVEGKVVETLNVVQMCVEKLSFLVCEILWLRPASKLGPTFRLGEEEEI